MADVNHCTAGRNAQGQWHIACREPASSGVGILQNMRYTNDMSSPNEKDYEFAARHICQRGGTSWTTNTLIKPTTCKGMGFSGCP